MDSNFTSGKSLATFIVASIVKLVVGLRVDGEDEVNGLDFSEHGESAYDLSGTSGVRRSTGGASILTANEAEEVTA